MEDSKEGAPAAIPDNDPNRVKETNIHEIFVDRFGTNLRVVNGG